MELQRRNVLAGIAAAPALLALHTTGASAVGSSTTPASPGTRHFPWPLIRPGSTITWPAGVVAVASDGASRVDLASISTIPARGASSQHVYLTGPKGTCTYTVSTPGRRPVNVIWDADGHPYLRVWGEYGAASHYPYRGRYFGLIVTPVARPARAGGAAT